MGGGFQIHPAYLHTGFIPVRALCYCAWTKLTERYDIMTTSPPPQPYHTGTDNQNKNKKEYLAYGNCGPSISNNKRLGKQFGFGQAISLGAVEVQSAGEYLVAMHLSHSVNFVQRTIFFPKRGLHNSSFHPVAA